MVEDTMASADAFQIYFTLSLLLSTALFYKYVFHPAVLSPLSRIPQPHWSCSISPIWILWARYNSRENRTLFEAHRDHGPIVRVGPSELSVNSVDAVKTIYQGGFDKHQWYSVFENYGVPNVFSAASAQHHSIRKRMVSHVYSKSYIGASASLAAQADLVLNGRLLPCLAASTAPHQEPHGLDVHSLFGAAAMDLITAYCFGAARSTDFIRATAYRAHWHALYATRKAHGFFAQELPGLSAALRRVLRWGLTPAFVGAANREIEAWCRRMSDATIEDLLWEQQQGKDDEDDVKGEEGATARAGGRGRGRGRGRRRRRAVAANTADDPVVVRALLAGLDKEEEANGAASPIHATALQQRELAVASETIDHVLAGQETTGVALTYLTYHLSRSLDLQRRIRTELLSLQPNMKLPLKNGDGSGAGAGAAIPDSRQLDALPLLHAVVTETVRRYAPAGGPEPRVTPAPSCRIGPYDVPGGVRVSASPYNLHRDEAVFPEPEAWDHTRWLPREKSQGGAIPAATEEIDEEEKEGRPGLSDVHRQFWGFSSGGRMCLGSNFAMHAMKLTIAAIYSNYTSHIVDDTGIEPTDAYTGHPASNSLYLRFERVTDDDWLDT